MPKRVAIIGAGVSGLTSIRQALQYGFEPVCFEASDDIGGLWRYKPYETNEPSVMKTTVINTSKEMSAFSDFPPPPQFFNFMHNTQLLDYLRLYAKEFDLERYVRFKHSVRNILRSTNYEETGQWIVIYTTETDTVSTETFDGVLVCTGHHTVPYWPESWDGEDIYKGQIIHSHSYKDHRGYEDKVVVVIGIGNSGGDIAVDLSRVAKKVYLATRRGTWVMNRIGDYGKPFDLLTNSRWTTFISDYLPSCVLNWMIESKLERRFNHSVYGLKPSHRFLSAHITVNDELPNRIACGAVKIKPNIASFTETGVVFVDGTVVDPVNAVICSTGYSFEFPIVEDGKLMPVVDNEVSLFKYMYPPELAAKNTLAVIGLVQPLGSIMPISELQARLFFEALVGNVSLPNANKMMVDIEKKRRMMKERYVKSRRHTIQVDYVAFMNELGYILGVTPSLFKMAFCDPILAYQLLFGPNLPYTYRLIGPHSWHGARDAIMDVWKRSEDPTRKDVAKKVNNRSLTKIFYALSAAPAIACMLLYCYKWKFV